MQIMDLQEHVKASTNTLSLIEGSVLDATQAASVSYTFINTGDESIDFIVVGANLPDMSDAVALTESASIASGSISTYASSLPPYSYYGIQIKSSVDNLHGEMTLHARAKG